MGMAASQARLLSITTRLSDNELRAQVINNSKMRLASESSRVSENYVSALNNSTMMLTNTDASGNSQYQALNFNNLTQYSATNNQFGLVNASGNLLVSEREAALYKKAVANKPNDSLTEYLKSHGLIFKSTYFENLATAHEEGGLVGKTGYSAAQLKQLYFGASINDGGKWIDTEGNVSFDGKKHHGYKTALTSVEYLKYDSLMSNYSTAKESFLSASKSFLNDDLKNFKDNSGKTFGKLKEDINAEGATLASAKGWVNSVKEILNNMADSNKLLGGRNSEFYIELSAEIKRFEDGDLGYTTAWGDNNAVHNSIIVYQPNSVSGDYDAYLKITKTGNADNPYTFGFYDSEGNEIPNAEGESLYYDSQSNSIIFKSEDTDEEGNASTYTETFSIPSNWESGINGQPAQVVVKSAISPKDTTEEEEVARYKSFLNNITAYIDKNAYENMNIFAYSEDDWKGEMKNRVEAFKEAAMALSQFIFGNNGNSNTWLILDDIKAIQKTNQKTTPDFETILDVVVIEELFDTYGEPNDSWAYIDENKTGNADAEAKWYTNLFNRMQEGYKVLENGLASSSEWIQYALESGLVTMEQVDSKSNWTSTMYANVSTITEKTNSNQTTIAEAEYNREMNRIQSKDKQYDMELKNIDTEHNSLQTEYDSIKSVIDKNIERNLKLYSA